MSDEELLTLEEVAVVCAVTPEWLRDRVEEGLVPAAPEWRFSAVAVRRVRRGDLVVAYENDCPHARQPMERPDGRVVMLERKYLVCSAHGASFRIEDGACAGGPAKGGLTPFPVETRDGAIYAA